MEEGRGEGIRVCPYVRQLDTVGAGTRQGRGGSRSTFRPKQKEVTHMRLMVTTKGKTGRKDWGRDGPAAGEGAGGGGLKTSLETQRAR